ncbi:MAG: phenylalanine--tRNA ligase subunit beta [Desulfobacterales bacterium]|nr:phenylalanine--tRNA ligase subunit beta [Desulfobacterales bacterium]
MKVSLNWLKDYVDIQMEVKDLAHLLTMAGLEVEGAHSTGEELEKVVVAELVSLRKHPTADRLTLVEARTDQGTHSIVCGATNIREGQKVPLALVGARLPNGVEIKRSKIRGETSEGMLCSEIELGLGQDATGILILPPDVPLGMGLGEALGIKDTILNVGITPNRSDCLCVMGVAREVAALTHQKMKRPRSLLSDEGREIHQRTTVTLQDPDLCPRYVARMIEGVKIGPSPYWMRNRLGKVGVRSINNVVDVTNYVMMECGQPLHAFDFDLLEEGRIVVRRALVGETFVTLDGVKRPLDSQMLMICDGVKPVAIAGVMGGLNSEIRQETQTVFLESAYFDPMGNRRTSLKLGLDTEASYRFGRGVDHGGTLFAASRAAQLIHEWAGGRVVEGVVDAYPTPIPSGRIRLSVPQSNQILGTGVPAERIRAHLEALELTVEREGDGILWVTPPSFRGDLTREIDLVEEVARMEGYDQVPVTLPEGSPAASSEEKSKEFLVERKAREALSRHGYDEVITYSFASPASLDALGLAPEDPRRRCLQVRNPLSEDLSILRTSLIPGLLETARYNFSRKNLNFKIFEMKRVFLAEEGERLPREKKYLTGLATGFDADPHWAKASRPVDFYDVKGLIEDLLEALHVKGVRFSQVRDIPYLHPGKTARVWVEEGVWGILGEIHPQILDRYEFPGKAYLFEIDFDQVLAREGEERRVKLLPKFPAVYRDLSLVVDEALEAADISKGIWNLQQPFIDEVNLFDVYQGAPIPQGKKGVSYRIRYQSNDRTLTDEEVNQYHNGVISRLRDAFQAELRR